MNMNNIFRKILNEAFYKIKDIDDHGFDYLRQVLDNLENNNTISLKTKGSTKGVETDITHLKTKEFKNNVTRFQNWLNNTEDNKDTLSISNKIGTSKDDYKSAENRASLLKAFNDFFCDKNTPLKQWTNIEKTDYSIIRTPEQESIQAIFLAAKIKGDDCFDQILNNSKLDWGAKCIALKEKLYNNALGITLKNDKINFSNKKNQDVLEKLVNILNIKSLEELSHLEKEDFTIIHPDGLKNINNKVNSEEIAKLTKVLFGNGIKWEVENQGYSLTLQKDNFIPADLYIIPLEKNKLEKLISKINAEGDLNYKSIVKLSNNLMGTGDEEISEPLIYPISLKMPSDNPKIEKIINSKNENTIEVGMNNIKFIHFNPKGNSTMGIRYGDKKLVLEFRSKGKSDKAEEYKPWQCNAKNKDNTNAIEGGSAKNYMRFVFRDDMNGSIDEKDVKEIAKVFKSKITDKPHFTKSLAESFKRFFEDDVEEVDYNEEDNELTLNDTENEHTWNKEEQDVLLAVPNMKEDGLTPKRGESSAKEGNIGLGLFCKKLIENDIEKNLDYNEKLSQIVQMSFKMNEIVQDTWKIT